MLKDKVKRLQQDLIQLDKATQYKVFRINPKQSLSLDPTYGRDYVYLEDVVRALLDHLNLEIEPSNPYQTKLTKKSNENL